MLAVIASAAVAIQVSSAQMLLSGIQEYFPDELISSWKIEGAECRVEKWKHDEARRFSWRIKSEDVDNVDASLTFLPAGVTAKAWLGRPENIASALRVWQVNDRPAFPGVEGEWIGGGTFNRMTGLATSTPDVLVIVSQRHEAAERAKGGVAPKLTAIANALLRSSKSPNKNHVLPGEAMDLMTDYLDCPFPDMRLVSAQVFAPIRPAPGEKLILQFGWETSIRNGHYDDCSAITRLFADAASAERFYETTITGVRRFDVVEVSPYRMHFRPPLGFNFTLLGGHYVLQANAIRPLQELAARNYVRTVSELLRGMTP